MTNIYKSFQEAFEKMNEGRISLSQLQIDRNNLIRKRMGVGKDLKANIDRQIEMINKAITNHPDNKARLEKD